MTSLSVLSVASEAYPLIKTGGLADVVGALPAALEGEGILVRTLLPGYPRVLSELQEEAPAEPLGHLFGGEATLRCGRAGGLGLFVLDAPHLFVRPGNPYLAPGGGDWPDNAFRFAGLAKAAAALANGSFAGFLPDIVHCHDWQAGLAPAYLQYGGQRRAGTVMTAHNVAFQGQFPAELLGLLDLPPRAYAIDGVEYYGSIGFLKAGLQLADRITTVSPTYAAEILEPEAGMGMQGLLRQRASVLSGILNGIDDRVWDPATDQQIVELYDKRRLARRGRNKAALQERLGLAAEPDTLLFGVVSRLSWQKGLDLLLEELPTLIGCGAQLAVLGAGDRPMEQGFAWAATANPGRIACVFGYDEGLAHMIQAGSDAVLVPSRFEPCGLTQLCALRYGAIPIVARAGGLVDTVIDANEMALQAGVGTGIQFASGAAPPLGAAIRRAAGLWLMPAAWAKLQRNAMATDVSWRGPARRYAALYRELAAERAAETCSPRIQSGTCRIVGA